MRHTIQSALACIILLAMTSGCVYIISGPDIDRAENLVTKLYNGEVVPNVRAFNGHLGGKPLRISTGTSHLLWDKHASCFFPFWDSPFVFSSGEPSIAPDEIRPLLLDIQRASAICRYDMRIVIECPMSRWDGVFVIGPYGKYVKGLNRLDKHMADSGQSLENEEHFPEFSAWPEHDRAFVTNVYAGEVIWAIKAFTPEQGGRLFSVISLPTGNRAVCYFPFWDSPYVQARGEVIIRPFEVRPLLCEMQRVSQEQGYKYPIDIECRGSELRFTIGPAGRYITGLNPFEESLRKRVYEK